MAEDPPSLFDIVSAAMDAKTPNDAIVNGLGLAGSGFTSTDVQNQSTVINHIATSAQQSAAAASATLQATQAATDAGVTGANFNFSFSGADGTTLAGADFTTGPTSGDIVIRGSNGYVGILASRGDSTSTTGYYAICQHQVTTDNQSIAMTLGDQGGLASTNTTLYFHCNSTMTAGAYCQINNGGFTLGYFTMSAGTFTYTPFTSAVVLTIQTGYRIKVQNIGTTYTVYVNGVQQLSYIDSGAHVTMDASHRYAGFSMERTTSAGGWFQGSRIYDSFRAASLSFIDYTAGATVAVSSWALRRASGTQVTLGTALSPGAVSKLPASYLDTQDYANVCTVTTLGTGVVTITTAGFYWVAFTIQQYGYQQNLSFPYYAPSYYVLYINGTLYTQGIPSGVPYLIHLAVGDTIQPGNISCYAPGEGNIGGGSGTVFGQTITISKINGGSFIGYLQAAA